MILLKEVQRIELVQDVLTNVEEGFGVERSLFYI